MRVFRIACVLLMFGSFVSPTFSQTDATPSLMFRSLRAMALGNAYEAIADDANALHYNPAGLAQSQRTRVEILLLRPRLSFDVIGETAEVQDLMDAIQVLSHSQEPLTDPGAAEARDTIIDALDRLMDEHIGLAADMPSIHMGFPLVEVAGVRLALGLGATTQQNAYVDIARRGLAWSDPIKAVLDDEVIFRAIAQWSLVAGVSAEVPLSLPLLSRIYGGISVRRITRYVFSDEDDPFTLEDVLQEDFTETYFDIQEGDTWVDILRNNTEKQTGYTANLGLMIMPARGVRFGLAFRNVLGGLTEANSGMDLALPTNVSLSTAVKPLQVLGLGQGLIDLTVAASIDDPSGDDFLSQFSTNRYDWFHFGVEAVLWPDAPLSLAARAGNNQGFATLGVGLRLGPLEFQAARYGDLQTDWYVGSLALSF